MNCNIANKPFFVLRTFSFEISWILYKLVEYCKDFTQGVESSNTIYYGRHCKGPDWGYIETLPPHCGLLCILSCLGLMTFWQLSREINIQFCIEAITGRREVVYGGKERPGKLYLWKTSSFKFCGEFTVQKYL